MRSVLIFNPYGIHDDIDEMREQRSAKKTTYSGQQQTREERITSVRYAKGADVTDQARVYVVE